MSEITENATAHVTGSAIQRQGSVNSVAASESVSDVATVVEQLVTAVWLATSPAFFQAYAINLGLQLIDAMLFRQPPEGVEPGSKYGPPETPFFSRDLWGAALEWELETLGVTERERVREAAQRALIDLNPNLSEEDQIQYLYDNLPVGNVSSDLSLQELKIVFHRIGTGAAPEPGSTYERITQLGTRGNDTLIGGPLDDSLTDDEGGDDLFLGLEDNDVLWDYAGGANFFLAAQATMLSAAARSPTQLSEVQEMMTSTAGRINLIRLLHTQIPLPTSQTQIT